MNGPEQHRAVASNRRSYPFAKAENFQMEVTSTVRDAARSGVQNHLAAYYVRTGVNTPAQSAAMRIPCLKRAVVTHADIKTRGTLEACFFNRPIGNDMNGRAERRSAIRAPMHAPFVKHGVQAHAEFIADARAVHERAVHERAVEHRRLHKPALRVEIAHDRAAMLRLRRCHYWQQQHENDTDNCVDKPASRVKQKLRHLQAPLYRLCLQAHFGHSARNRALARN